MSKDVIVEWTVPCKRLPETLEFYTAKLGFRIDAIFPADAPRVAHISGCGTRIRLEQSDNPAPASLRLIGGAGGTESDSLISPDGTRIERVSAVPELSLPTLDASPVVNRLADAASAWGAGRAGMHYRDLVPGRQDGALIASHIRITEGGPVPDYVHHHLVLFQLIYCAKGWVRVVYEDQGPEFVLQEGDCVLQPPGIRHRVLESSPGMEVIEVSAPAEHMTFVDHELSLPTAELKPERKYGGQSFVRHVSAAAEWQMNAEPGFDIRDTGLTEASEGLITLQVLRANHSCLIPEQSAEDELQFFFVLEGSGNLTLGGQIQQIAHEDSFIVPGGMPWQLNPEPGAFELLRLGLHRY